MSSPRFRPALDSIPVYKAGKPPTLAPGLTSYKLSSNENPYPPLAGVVEQAVRAVGTMNRYPDMGVSVLYEALVAKLGVAEEQLATGTGSVAVLYHLLQALCAEGDEVVYAWRSFEAYPIAVGLTGATDVPVPVTREARHDLPAMLAAITPATKAVLVCTPNNPTGPAVRGAELRAFIDAVPDHIVVVIDEAYCEFVTDPDVVDGVTFVHGRDNVVVLRTFSKAYGLAGFRLGYAVGSTAIAQAIRKCALPFGVSAIAQTAAVASLQAEPELLERVAALVVERSRVVDELRAQGWNLPDAQGNFVWLPLGDRTLDFAAQCNEQGVSVRPFAGDGVRVTIGETDANDIFLKVAGAARA